MKIIIYDATLREGAQGAGASYTIEDKLRIARILDELCVDYIEGGNPGSNPKDAEFYQQMRKQPLSHAKLVAFGSTCRVGSTPEEDGAVQALVQAGTEAVAIFGKCWDFHATEILGATLEQNLHIIYDTVSYFKHLGKEVIFDAEHFFDGYKRNPDYAMQCLGEAHRAGADWLVLCDTNGGCFPHEIQDITAAAMKEYDANFGIHCHNDTDMASANTVAAVREGATMAQVTINGMGERCGNADLCITVPNLQLKLGYDCIPADKIPDITSLALTFEDISNSYHNPRQPYIGKNAFAHKGGMHIDAVNKAPESFEHILPEQVGNKHRILLSEVSGRAAILEKIRRVDPALTKDSPKAQAIVDKIKRMEFNGYQFEGADASFELLVRRELNDYEPFFKLTDFRVLVEEPAEPDKSAGAMIEVEVGGEQEVTAANGNGPVNALDNAARKALERFYPSLRDMYLSDFKVRVLQRGEATASVVRVSIESRDDTAIWHTVGVSADIIQACWVALVDSLEYKLLKDEGRQWQE